MNKATPHGHTALPDLMGAGRGSRLWPQAVAGLLWLAAGLCAGYWVLLAWGRTPVVPVSAPAMALPSADPQAVARVLGALPQAATADAAVVVPATRYSLVGVVTRNAVHGAALIAVDGQAARPYTVGASLEGGLVLQAVGPTSARLGTSVQAPASVELILPEVDPVKP
ncbi:type II secretion system protein N [Hydrogenophaga sp.]|uniref:type II secretion system protein N n=1 Tax=Hydrogenophaga sp. TaxID=1904254 RepID=UPI003566EDDB